MSLKPTEVLFLQRLLKDRPASRQANGIASAMCTHYSLGVAAGRHIVYLPHDWDLVENLLRSHDVPTVRLEGKEGRIEQAAFGGISEKAFSEAPHADTVAIRVFGACRLDDHALFTPPGCYLALTRAAARQIACDRLLVVENLDSFRRLERYAWLDMQGMSVMAIYRGDNIFNARDAQVVILERTEPIWAFFDFDPAGLMLANALPEDRLESVLLPDFERLAELCDTPRGRELFNDQYGGCHRQLDASKNPLIGQPWNLLKRLQCGATQERMGFL